MFKFLYETKDMTSFGDHCVAPKILEHVEETLVAKYPKVGGDGQAVEVYCTAAPARFYTVKALEGKNSVNEPQKSFEISTGSGKEMEKLAAVLAEQIAEGMIGVKV